MGYKRKAKTFTLVFEDAEYDGLEIETKSLPLGDFLDVSKRFQKDQQTDEDVEATLAVFAAAVVRWNLEDDNDQVLPTTLDGLKTLDLDFVFAVIAAWLGGMTAPQGDLGKASNSGDSSLEASMRMGDL